MYALHKTRSSSTSTMSTKYYIKCDAVDTAERIEIVKLLQKQRDEDSRVLLAYLDTHQGKANIVVKMGRENSTIRKEYSISERLYEMDCHGFVKFTCLFECYDNNSADKICQGTPGKDPKKDILIMRYYNEGSIKRRAWTNASFHILRSVLVQTIYSLTVAYNTTGFVHNDSHLDNILVKRTARLHNSYSLDSNVIEVETNNYTCLILDFENCFFTDKKSPIFFWKMMENIIARVGIELMNNKGDKIEATNVYEILGYISKNKNSDYLRILRIIPMIEEMQFTILERPATLAYDPNKF
jgi:hypothetical protein